MIKVITYGTFDLLHYGHKRLLERAKALGDYLIVGVTADDFDRKRGKINVKQSLMERIEGVRATGLADEIIVEEFDGQKIDDIRRYGIDIFTVGTDWEGKFDYLGEYCRVVYLERTEGVSSSGIRDEKRKLRFGIAGDTALVLKYAEESKYVNGMQLSGFADMSGLMTDSADGLTRFDSYEALLGSSDAIYIAAHPRFHYEQIKKALNNKKHVLCESPIAMNRRECEELFRLAEENGCILMDAIKTAYSTAYSRLMLLVKSGVIGDVVSVDSVCTSLRDITDSSKPISEKWSSMLAWGPTALLPVFDLLGTEYRNISITSKYSEADADFDLFTKIDFVFDSAVASIKAAKGVKSEGELIISGTVGYVYVPAPWWKTDYFEVRYEETEKNKRYFYQLDGEGIRCELAAFVKSIENRRSTSCILPQISYSICDTAEKVKNAERI